jgi:hypothetical protein
MSSPKAAPEGGTPPSATPETSLVPLIAHAAAEDPAVAEERWEKLTEHFKTEGSVLFRWLALLELQRLFWHRAPHAQIQYVPTRQRPRILKMRMVMLAIENDTGVCQATAYREIGYAKKLLQKLGLDKLKAMLGSNIANDDRFLRKLIRVENPEQASNAVSMHVEGAGKRAAKKLIDFYLQEQEEAAVHGADERDDHEQPQEPAADEESIAWSVNVEGMTEVTIGGYKLVLGVTAVEGETVTGFLALASAIAA